MFNHTHFHTNEFRTRLLVIIMHRLGKNIITPFNDLLPTEQYEFNIKLNEYIDSLPSNFEETIIDDFTKICNETLFTSKFNPQQFAVQTTFCNEISTCNP